jgi:hypothetical protein
MSIIFTLLAVAAAALIALVAGPVPARDLRVRSGNRSGIVDGSGWDGVYNVLKREGYNVSLIQKPTLSRWRVLSSPGKTCPNCG